MKKLIALFLALCMVFALCACGAKDDAPAAQAGSQAAADPAAPVNSDEVYTVSIQFSFPEESADGAKQVMSAIEEASGGRIQFEVYYSYSYVDAGDLVDALETNQLDIAGLMPTEHASVFPLNGAMTALPLMNYPDWEASTKIYLSMLYNNADMMAEFTDNGMVFWAGYMCPGYQLYSSKALTDVTPSVYNGLTVMCDNAQMQQFINQNKGGAISVFPPDYLSNLQNGVADTLVQHVNCAFVFGCFDYIDTAIFFGEGGFYNLPLVYAFSERFWNDLPADLQAIFAEYADDMCYASHMSDMGLYANVAMPALQASANIITLDDAQIAAWQDAIKPIVDSAMTDIAGDSPNAPAALEQLKTMIANYDAATFQIGTNNFGHETVWGSAAPAAEAAPAAAGEVAWADYQAYLIEKAGANAPDLAEFEAQVYAINSWEELDQTVSPWDQMFTTIGLSTWEEFQNGIVKDSAVMGSDEAASGEASGEASEG